MRLETLRNKLNNDYNMVIDDDDLMIHIIEFLPSGGYESLKTSFIRQVASVVDPLTIENMKIQLKANTRFKNSDEYKTETNEDKELYSKFRGQCETCGLNGHSSRTCFKNMKCSKCGKSGHVDDECWQTTKFSICNKYGHPDAICWYKDNNSEIRPEEWQKIECDFFHKIGHTEKYCYVKKYLKENEDKVENNDEKPRAFYTRFETNGEEKGFKMVDFDDQQLWIGDSGASHHITNTIVGMTNIK